ncbi:hypothetical protein ABK040_000912 [Willaertia magna]
MGAWVSYITHTGNAITIIMNDSNNDLMINVVDKDNLFQIDKITGMKYLTLEGMGKYLDGVGSFEGFIDNKSKQCELLKLFYNHISFKELSTRTTTVDVDNMNEMMINNVNEKISRERKWMIKKEEIKRLPLKLPEFKGPFVNCEKITTMEQLDEVMNYCKRSKNYKEKIIFNFKLNAFNDININCNKTNCKDEDYNNYFTTIHAIDKQIFKKLEIFPEPNRIYFRNDYNTFYVEFFEDGSGFELVNYNFYYEDGLDRELKDKFKKEIGTKLCEEMDFKYLTVDVYKAHLE